MRLLYKFLGAICIIIVLLSLTFSINSYYSEEDHLLKGIDEKLYTSALMLRSVLGEEYHDLLNPNTFSPEEYDQIIVERNNRLCEELGIQYLWSNMVIGNDIVFTSSTSPSHNVSKKDHAGFFDVHNDPGAFSEVLKTMKPTYSSFHNEWGDGRMVLIPFTDKNGRVYVFGSSVSTEEVNDLLNKTLLRTSTFAVIALLIGILISTLMAYGISGRISMLEKASRQFMEGKIVDISGIGNADEVGRLAKTLKKMSQSIREGNARVQEQTQKLEKEVARRTKELSETNQELMKFHKLAVGREITIMQLKKKIKELERRR
jgi:methyl-accepting chemotaxis protein